MYYVIIAMYAFFLTVSEVKRDVIFAVGALLTSGIAMTSVTLQSGVLLGVDVFTLPTLMFILAFYSGARVLLQNTQRVE